MKGFLRLVVCVSLVTLVTAAAVIAGTKVVHRWVLTGVPMPKIENMMVAGVLENYLIRQEFEDEMEKLLAKNGVKGIKSHMVLPPKNEMMEGELKQRIKESPLDAVLVVRPKEARQESEEVVTSSVWMPPPGYYAFWPYWTTAYTEVATSSYTENYTVVRCEFNLYYVKDEKLIWSGETDTVYSKDFEKLAKSYAKSIVNQMKKDKVIGKK